MAINTDAMFSADTRMISAKIDIYLESQPLEVTKDDYLVDFDLQEEIWNMSSGVFGEMNPNTIDITLLNEDRIFSPNNTEGPYYGKIKNGTKIALYMRGRDDAEWLPMGTFYTTEWKADAGGMVAYIYASNSMIDVFKKDAALVMPKQGVTYKDFLDYYFNAVGISATVDTTLADRMQWGYSTGTIANDLELLTQASWSWCGYDRNNLLRVKSLLGTKTNRLTLTDNDQVQTVSAKQSTIKSYDGVKLLFNVPNALETELIKNDSFEVTAGINQEVNVPFSKTPVVSITSIDTDTTGTRCTVYGFRYTPRSLFLRMQSSGMSATSKLKVVGQYLDNPEYMKVDTDRKSLFEYKNPFIQFGDYANTFKNRLGTFVSLQVPSIEVEVRGNLLLELGDKLTLNSSYYSTIFYGRLAKIHTTYDGSLSQKLTLLDSSIFE